MNAVRRLFVAIRSISIINTITISTRLALATVANYYLSNLIFNPQFISPMDKNFRFSPVRSISLFKNDMNRLRKMNNLWPVYDSMGLSLLFTLALYIFFEYFARPENLYLTLRRMDLIKTDAGSTTVNSTTSSDSTTAGVSGEEVPSGSTAPLGSTASSERKVLSSSTLSTYLSPRLTAALRVAASCAVGTALFYLILPMQRIAEMHIYVILINYFHTIVTCVLTNLVMFTTISLPLFSSNKLKSE